MPDLPNKSNDFLSKINDLVDNKIATAYVITDKERKYLMQQAPNIIEWVTGVEYWNVPSTYRFSRQYQILRDMFNLRCKICNPQDPESIDCWNKPRSYLESEALLVWDEVTGDFVCPKCKNTLHQFVLDGVVVPYNELICIAGMRSGKSFLGAHIGGYVEHIIRCKGAAGKGYLQRFLHQEKAEWFEVTFAASTAAQARDTIYAKYREMRNNSPWIQKYVDWVKGLEKQQIGSGDKWEYKPLDDTINDGYLQVRFNRVSSNSSGIAGKTRIFAAIDELARLADSESKMSAQELYRVLNQSLKTVRGAVRKYSLFPFFGTMINVTSPLYFDDLAMQLYNKVAQGEIKRSFGWKGATWEFNPELTIEDFREDFEKDPVGAQRDFGADPPAAESPLIVDVPRFWKSIDFKREPIAKFERTYLTDATGKKYVGARLKEIMYNFVDNHYIFCDAAESFDSFAVVCAHPVIVEPEFYKGSFYKNVVEPRDAAIAAAKDESQYEENYVNCPPGMVPIQTLPMDPNCPLAEGKISRKGGASIFNSGPESLGRLVTVVDFCLRIVPTREREIWFNSIIEVILELKKKIKIAGVCFDQWQSTSSIQAIRDSGVPSYKVKLKTEHFLEFVAQIYNDQVSLLPPHPEDLVSISDRGTLRVGTNEEDMEGESVGIVELLKLERSPDLRRIFAPRKGLVRGRDSDDIARCIVGVNYMVKESIVNNYGFTGRKRELRKLQVATGSSRGPRVFNPRHMG